MQFRSITQIISLIFCLGAVLTVVSGCKPRSNKEIYRETEEEKAKRLAEEKEKTEMEAWKKAEAARDAAGKQAKAEEEAKQKAAEADEAKKEVEQARAAAENPGSGLNKQQAEEALREAQKKAEEKAAESQEAARNAELEKAAAAKLAEENELAKKAKIEKAAEAEKFAEQNPAAVAQAEKKRILAESKVNLDDLQYIYDEYVTKKFENDIAKRIDAALASIDAVMELKKAKEVQAHIKEINAIKLIAAASTLRRLRQSFEDSLKPIVDGLTQAKASLAIIENGPTLGLDEFHKQGDDISKQLGIAEKQVIAILEIESTNLDKYLKSAQYEITDLKKRIEAVK